jgi:acetoacetyl-CoA reductase
LDIGGALSEKVAVITGGTGGLGTALVKRLRDRDLKFAVTYLVPDEAAAFEEAIDLDEDRLILRRVDAINAEAFEIDYSVSHVSSDR